VAGTTSSPAQILACVRLSHPDRRPESQARRHARQGDDDAKSEHCTRNPRRGGRDDWEECNLNPKGPGPKAFRSNVCDAHFLKRFWVLNNVVKYDVTKISLFVLKTTALHAGWVRLMTTYSSSSSSTFTYPTLLGPDWTTCQETRSIVRRISRRSSPTIFRACMCDSTTPGT
jgi:hypothetical protein